MNATSLHSRMAAIIIDSQGFRGIESEFVFKEITAVSINCETFYTFLLSAPKEITELPEDIKRQNSWLTNNHHGLDYNKGFTSYTELYNVIHGLLSDFQTVYVKGSQKKTDLENIFYHENIINLEDLGCPSLEQLSENYCNTACLWHDNKSLMCATRNVKNILFWYNEHFRPGRMPESHKDDECTSTCWCFCE